MRTTLRTVLTGLLGLTLSTSLPLAGNVDWSASFGMTVGDDTYLNLSVNHFDSDPGDAVIVAKRLSHPAADLPVLLFLARESGKSTAFILDLRMEGLSWWQIRARLGVAPDRVIVALPRDPGPPYGKAWGHYKNGKHKSGGAAKVVLSDAEFRDWVGVRVLAASYGVEPMVVIEARRAGTSLAAFSVKHKHRGNAGKSSAARAPARGHGKGGKSKGRS